MITDASELGAPIYIHNLTRHVVSFKQAGVPLHNTVQANEIVRCGSRTEGATVPYFHIPPPITLSHAIAAAACTTRKATLCHHP